MKQNTLKDHMLPKSATNFVLFLSLGCFYFIIQDAPTFNLIHYWLLVSISLMGGFCIWISIILRAKHYGAKFSSVPLGVNICGMLFVALLTSCPLQIAMLIVNEYCGRDLSENFQSKIQAKDMRFKRYGSSPQLIVMWKFPDQTKPFIYPMDVSWDLYKAFQVGEDAVISVRKGALGFSYVSSIEKAGQ